MIKRHTVLLGAGATMAAIPNGDKNGKKSSGVGAGLTRLYTGDLYSIYCALPPLVEQEEIADYLDIKCAEIDKLIAKKEQLVKELESYKKSLIYEVVTGKREV